MKKAEDINGLTFETVKKTQAISDKQYWEAMKTKLLIAGTILVKKSPKVYSLDFDLCPFVGPLRVHTNLLLVLISSKRSQHHLNTLKIIESFISSK